MTTRYSAKRRLAIRLGQATVFATVFCAAAIQCDVRPSVFKQSFAKGLALIGQFFPPLWSQAPEMLEAIAITLVLAAAASLIGMLLAFPVGLAAASNIAPIWIRLPVRLLLGLERAIPEVISILFFVVAFGVGPFAGMCALSVSSIGMLGKLVGDAIEEADPAVLESVRAAGGGFWQTVRYGLIPQVLAALAATGLLRFDLNVRASVILGAAGAGGIGEEMRKSMGMLQYDRATVAVLGSLILIYAAESFSGHLRQRLLGTQTA